LLGRRLGEGLESEEKQRKDAEHVDRIAS
jgi:hypothetical protein